MYDINITGLAAILQTSENTIRRWVAKGLIPKPRVIGPTAKYWPREVIDPVVKAIKEAEWYRLMQERARKHILDTLTESQ